MTESINNDDLNKQNSQSVPVEYDDEEKTQTLSIEEVTAHSPKRKDRSHEDSPEPSILDLHTPEVLTAMEVVDLGEPTSCDSGHLTPNKKLPESMGQIFLQSFIPFFIGGFGSIVAGLLLTFGNRSLDLMKEVPEFLVLMPPLQGLKGNLDMTFSARMSTLAHVGEFEKPGIRRKIARNMSVSEAQSIFVCIVSNLVAFLIVSMAPSDVIEHVEENDRNETKIYSTPSNSTEEHSIGDTFVFLASSSVFAMCINCAISTFLLSSIVFYTRRTNCNPDNIVTPIGASIGDLLTITGMLIICYSLRPFCRMTNLYPTVIITLAISSIPLWLYLAKNDPAALRSARQQCITLVFATSVSCIAGYIQSVGALKFPNYPAYQTLISGLTGNRCAVQASRISSYLEVHKKSEVDWSVRISPYQYYIDPCNESKTARLLLFTSVPFQLVFVFLSTGISVLLSIPTEMDYRFFVAYVIVIFIQVLIIMYITQLLVVLLWKMDLDPDVHSIPLLTSTADLIGCALLYVLFISLNSAFECVLTEEKDIQ